MTTHYQTLVAEVEADVWPENPDTCVEWQHYRNLQGYGFCSVNGRSHPVHRVVFCLQIGITLAGIDGKIVRRSCGNPSCYRPSHLQLVTASENYQDCLKIGRQYQAQRTAKVTTDRERHAKRTQGQKAVKAAYLRVWRALRKAAGS